MFCKLGIIAALIAALAAPASAATHGARRAHQARAQIACPQGVHILPGRGYGMCGGGFYVRNPQTGQVKAIPFWRLQRLNDPREDQP